MSRGTRNFNPGNIERGASWQGLAEPHEMTAAQKAETRFAVFRSPEWGIRAIARILATYRDKHGLNTVRGIISRWAPSSENDVDSYAGAVSKAIFVPSGRAIDTTDPKIMARLITAIIRHENGEQPYSAETIRAGIAMAGVKAPRVKPLVKSKRLQGAAVTTAIAATLAQFHAVIAGAKSIVATISPDLANAGTSVTLLAIGGVALAVFALWVGWTVFSDYRDKSESNEPERG